MFSIVKCVPSNYKQMLAIDEYNVKIYQTYNNFIGVISLPRLYDKKFFLKMTKIETRVDMQDFDKFKTKVIDLSLNVLKVLTDTDNRPNSAILLMKPAYISTIFLASTIFTFMSQNNIKNPCLYSMCQILYSIFYKQHHLAEKKMLKTLKI